MNELFDRSLKLLSSAKQALANEMNSSLSYVAEMVNQLPVLISSERSQDFSDIQYDEKHYFVIPFKLSKIGIVLHTMRCLPENVPELNDLPKRRVFHFSREADEASIRKHLINEAKDYILEAKQGNVSSLESLANDIDRLDKKLTYGLLCIGGLAALVNPLAGAGIAAKALLPGVGSLLSKYTLRPIGEKISESQLKNEIKAAEEKITKDFESAGTVKVINPILQELELALNTTQSEHDPLFDFDLSQLDINEIDGNRWRELTRSALRHTYQQVLNDQSKHQLAGLGPEDLRWLSVILHED